VRSGPRGGRGRWKRGGVGHGGGLASRGVKRKGHHPEKIEVAVTARLAVFSSKSGLRWPSNDQPGPNSIRPTATATPTHLIHVLRSMAILSAIQLAD
jgi:hypothetical protein